MAIATKPRHTLPETAAELVHRLGNVPLERIRMRPSPGTAKVKDVVAALEATDKRLYELVDGVLVEKTMGWEESVAAVRIIARLERFVARHDLGLIAGADGAMEIILNLVRIPDVSFVSWEDLAGDDISAESVPRIVPRLAVEVISKGNTPQEMERKLVDYFEAGVRLVWYVYPKTQSAEVYTSPTAVKRLGKNQSLDGGDVLPGFKLPLKEIFRRPRRQRR